jgi:hypothetical protein
MTPAEQHLDSRGSVAQQHEAGRIDRAHNPGRQTRGAQGFACETTAGTT